MKPKYKVSFEFPTSELEVLKFVLAKLSRLREYGVTCNMQEVLEQDEVPVEPTMLTQDQLAHLIIEVYRNSSKVPPRNLVEVMGLKKTMSNQNRTRTVLKRLISDGYLVEKDQFLMQVGKPFESFKRD